MSKERDLLVSCLDEFQYHEVPCSDLIRAIRWVLAEPEEEGVYQKLLRIEKENYVEMLPSELWLDGYEAEKKSALLSKQPEKTEQEPVAWMLIDKETGARIPKAYKPEHGVNKDRWELYPLFASPPTREPLSDEDVFRLYEESEYLGFLAYRKGFKDAEKAHGIGVEL